MKRQIRRLMEHSENKKVDSQEQAVIRVSAADVMVRDYAPGSEEKTPEQLREEELAYLEDREPVHTDPPKELSFPGQEAAAVVENILRFDGPCTGRQREPSRLMRLCAAAAAVALLAGAWGARTLTSSGAYQLRCASNAAQAHNYERAEQILMRLVLLQPENPEVYLQLVAARQAMGAEDKAFATAQAGFEHTKDERLARLVSEYTFVHTPAETPGTQPPVRQEADPIVPAGLAQDAIWSIPARYEDARDYSDGLACVMHNGRWGVVDHTGAWVVQPTYEQLDGYFNGMCAMRQDGLWGYLDVQGATAVEPRFEQAGRFEQGRAPVCDDGVWYVLTQDGMLLGDGADELSAFTADGLAAAGKEGKWGFLGRDGTWLVSPAFEEVRPFCEGLAAVRIKGRWGYAGAGGAMLIDAQYTEAYEFIDGIARVKTANGYHYINPMGWQIGGVWEDARDFSEGFAVVAEDGKYGLIDRTGTVVIAPSYEQLDDVSQGRCAFMQNNRWGYLDAEGKQMIDARYTKADPFAGGMARVEDETGVSYINLAGQALGGGPFEEGRSSAHHRIAVRQKGLWGYLAVLEP